MKNNEIKKQFESIIYNEDKLEKATEALEVVRESGITNMFDKSKVADLLHNAGHNTLAAIVKKSRASYAYLLGKLGEANNNTYEATPKEMASIYTMIKIYELREDL